MRTQALIAQRWRDKGLFPHCVDQGAGRPGNDLLNTPGLAVEIKARSRAEILSTLRQAKARAKESEVAVAIWRHDGQGELSIDQWTVYLTLEDFETLWRKAHGATQG